MVKNFKHRQQFLSQQFENFEVREILSMILPKSANISY